MSEIGDNDYGLAMRHCSIKDDLEMINGRLLKIINEYETIFREDSVTSSVIPKGFGSFLMKRRKSIFQMEQNKLQEIYHLISNISLEETRNRLLEFMDDYRTLSKIVDQSSNERENILTEVATWLADNPLLVAAPTSQMGLALEVEEELRNCFMETLANMERLKQIKLQMAGMKIQPKNIQKDLVSVPVEIINWDQSLVSSFNGNTDWRVLTGDIMTLVRKKLHAEPDIMNMIEMRIDELSKTFLKKDDDLETSKRELAVKTKMICKVEQQKEVLMRKYAVLEKKIGEASQTAKQQVISVIPKDTLAPEIEKDASSSVLGQEEIEQNASSEMIVCEIPSPEKAISPLNYEEEAEKQADEYDKKLEVLTSRIRPQSSELAKEKKASEDKEFLFQSNDDWFSQNKVSDQVDLENMEKLLNQRSRRLKELLVQHIKNCCGHIQILSEEVLDMRNCARGEIREIRLKEEQIIKLERDVDSLIKKIDSHQNSLPCVTADEDALLMKCCEPGNHQCEYCFCHDVNQQTRILATFNTKVDLDEAMAQCSRYISILGEVEQTYANVYENMMDVYRSVKAAKSFLVWGQLGTSNQNRGEEKTDSQIMNILQVALSTPNSASELIIHAENCVQYIEVFIKEIMTLLNDSKKRAEDIMKQNNYLSDMENIICRVQGVMESTGLNMARVKYGGDWLETVKILQGCICPYCNCYSPTAPKPLQTTSEEILHPEALKKRAEKTLPKKKKFEFPSRKVSATAEPVTRKSLKMDDEHKGNAFKQIRENLLITLGNERKLGNKVTLLYEIINCMLQSASPKNDEADEAGRDEQTFGILQEVQHKLQEASCFTKMQMWTKEQNIISKNVKETDERRLSRKIDIDETTTNITEVQDLHSKTLAIPTSAGNKTLQMKKASSKPTAVVEKVRKVSKTSKSSTQDVFREEEQLKHFDSEADEHTKELINENKTTKPTSIKKLHGQEKEFFKKSIEEKLNPTEFISNKLKNKQEGDFDLISETFTSESQFTKQPGVQVSKEQKKEVYRIKHRLPMKGEPSKHLYDGKNDETLSRKTQDISVLGESSVSAVVEIKKKIPRNLSEDSEKTHLRSKDSDLLGEEKQEIGRSSKIKSLCPPFKKSLKLTCSTLPESLFTFTGSEIIIATGLKKLYKSELPVENICDKNKTIDLVTQESTQPGYIVSESQFHSTKTLRGYFKIENSKQKTDNNAQKSTYNDSKVPIVSPIKIGQKPVNEEMTENNVSREILMETTQILPERKLHETCLTTKIQPEIEMYESCVTTEIPADINISLLASDVKFSIADVSAVVTLDQKSNVETDHQPTIGQTAFIQQDEDLVQCDGVTVKVCIPENENSKQMKENAVKKHDSGLSFLEITEKSVNKKNIRETTEEHSKLHMPYSPKQTSVELNLQSLVPQRKSCYEKPGKLIHAHPRQNVVHKTQEQGNNDQVCICVTGNVCHQQNSFENTKLLNKTTKSDYSEGTKQQKELKVFDKEDTYKKINFCTNVITEQKIVPMTNKKTHQNQLQLYSSHEMNKVSEDKINDIHEKQEQQKSSYQFENCHNLRIPAPQNQLCLCVMTRHLDNPNKLIDPVVKVQEPDVVNIPYIRHKKICVEKKQNFKFAASYNDSLTPFQKEPEKLQPLLISTPNNLVQKKTFRESCFNAQNDPSEKLCTQPHQELVWDLNSTPTFNEKTATAKSPKIQYSRFKYSHVKNESVGRANVNVFEASPIIIHRIMLDRSVENLKERSELGYKMSFNEPKAFMVPSNIIASDSTRSPLKTLFGHLYKQPLTSRRKTGESVPEHMNTYGTCKICFSKVTKPRILKPISNKMKPTPEHDIIKTTIPLPVNQHSRVVSVKMPITFPLTAVNRWTYSYVDETDERRVESKPNVKRQMQKLNLDLHNNVSAIREVDYKDFNLLRITTSSGVVKQYIKQTFNNYDNFTDPNSCMKKNDFIFRYDGSDAPPASEIHHTKLQSSKKQKQPTHESYINTLVHPQDLMYHPSLAVTFVAVNIFDHDLVFKKRTNPPLRRQFMLPTFFFKKDYLGGKQRDYQHWQAKSPFRLHPQKACILKKQPRMATFICHQDMLLHLKRGIALLNTRGNLQFERHSMAMLKFDDFQNLLKCILVFKVPGVKHMQNDYTILSESDVENCYKHSIHEETYRAMINQ